MKRREVIKATEPTDEQCAQMEKQEAALKEAIKKEPKPKPKPKPKEPKPKPEKKDKPKEAKEKKTCGGKTKADEPCKRSAMTDNAFCAAHKK